MKKQNYLFSLSIFLAFIILSACTPQSQTEISPPPEVVAKTNTPAPTETPLPTPTPTVKVPMNGQETQYKLDVLVDYYNHFVTVEEEILYTNKSQDTINEIVLEVSPTYFQDAFYLKTLTDVNNRPLQNFNWESSRIRLPLETPLLPGNQLTLKLSFSLLLPVREGTFGYSGRQLNLSNWYPFIPPYQDGRGWQVHDLWLVNSQIVGEHLVYEVADFDVTLQFTDRRENMKIAAPSLADEEEGVIHYQLNLARGFTFSISDIFITHQIEQDGVSIISYAFPEHTTSCVAAAEITAQALKLYGELYTPYSRDIFSVIEADFFHGMEFDGMTLLSKGFYAFYDGTPLTNLTIVTPHEVSHQWFYSLVGNDQAIEPWLDEAMATYNEVLFYERYYPENVQWWWDNRIYGQNPSGFVNTSIYLPDGYVPYRNGVYLRGAIFIQAIRDTVGDEAFFDFLKDYVTSFAYENATKQNFFDTLALHSDADISPILEEYFQDQ